MLSDGVLYYFRDLPEFEPIATIDLGNTTVQSSGPREFQLQTPQRAFSLRAGDPAACEAWKEALQTQENVVMGFMEKRGQHNAVYRHRWFCLDPDDHTLSYFREAPEFAPIGAVQLRDVCSRPRLATSDRLHCFVVDTPERVFVMSASCAQEAQHWVEQLGLEIEQRLSAVEKQSLLAVHAGRLLRQVKGSISAYHCELHGRPSGSAELRAFEQADSAVPAWSMPLSPTTDVVSFERHARNATRSGHSGDSSYFSFMLEHGGQRFRFAAETEAAGRCWLSALAAYTRCKEDVMETSVAHVNACLSLTLPPGLARSHVGPGQLLGYTLHSFGRATFFSSPPRGAT